MKSYNLNNINLKEFPWPVQVFFIIFACVFIFYLVYGWDVSFLQRQLVRAQQQEQDLKVQVEAFSANLATINNDIAQLPQLEQLLILWQSKLVKPNDVPDLLSDILKMGTNNGLDFDTFSPGASVSQGAYVKMPIRAVAEGTYQEIATFISQVANMQWIVVISNFSLTSGSAAKPASSSSVAALQQADIAAGKLTAEMTLEVYYLAEK